MFFDEAILVRTGASSASLMQLIGGDRDLFYLLQEPGMLLSGTRSFTSDLMLQDCDELEDGTYYVDAIETRYYAEEEDMGTCEYRYLFYATIHSPTDYCITRIIEEYLGAVDDGGYDGYEQPGGGASGTSVSIYDDSDGIYDGPSDSAFYGPDGNYNESLYQLPELEAQRSYGTNAQIDDSAFSYVTVQIRSGDARWREDAERVSFGGGLEPTGAATRLYKDACEYLERMDEWAQYGSQMKYTQTPLYELAQYRYKSAVLVWGIN